MQIAFCELANFGTQTPLGAVAARSVAVTFAVRIPVHITARPWWRSGLESMATGIVAATVTYGAGRFFASP